MRPFFLFALGFVATTVFADDAGCIQGNCEDGFGEFAYAGDLAGAHYEGDWKDGKRHGKGVFESADGDRYQGAWRGDVRHGRGTYTHPAGFTYKGLWQSDMPHGKG